MPPICPPPPFGLRSQSFMETTPDLSAISRSEWHSASGDLASGLLACDDPAKGDFTGGDLASLNMEEVPLGPDRMGGAGPGGRNSSTPGCGGVDNTRSGSPSLQRIAEESEPSNHSEPPSFQLPGVLRVLEAASNGEWTSEEEGEDSTVVETTPPVSTHPHLPTRQSKVRFRTDLFIL